MAYTQEKEKARALRAKGESINHIATILNLQKSTVSLWCRDIALSASQIRALVNRQHNSAKIGSLMAAEIKRAARIQRTQEAKEEGAKDIGHLSPRDLQMLGIGLYWGEGYKGEGGEFGFTNSNPEMIKTFLAWVFTYDIHREDLILRVSINISFRSQSKGAVRYWSKITGTKVRQFTKTSFIKTALRKQYANKRSYFGTLRIKVRRGTSLKRRILGSIEHIAKTSIQLR